MKTITKLLTFCMVLAMTAMLATEATAQDRGNNQARPSPNSSVSQTIGTTVVSITYGRPSLRGRDVNTLINDRANGPVWRTGANESTAITFSDDVVVGDQAVPAGTYSLYTIPGDGSWTIIINKKMSWGTQYDEAQDVGRTTAATFEFPMPAESFTMYFDTLSNEKAHLNLIWGTIGVAIPITVAGE